MKDTDQVCSYDEALTLHALGLKAPSVFSWQKYSLKEDPILLYFGDIDREKFNFLVLSGTLEHDFPAYTVAELGDILKTRYVGSHWVYLPDFFEEAEKGNKWRCYIGGDEIGFVAHTEASARAKMLIYLLKNNLLEKKK